MYIEYRSIENLNQAVISNLSRFQYDFDLIVGIPRSGMLPANLIALYMNRPFTDIDSFIEGRIYLMGNRGKLIENKRCENILIVDDSIMSGSALSKAKAKIGDLEKQYNIKYGVVYATSNSCKLVDIYCEIIDTPRIFQWNLFHHPYYLSMACFDIDGVLCMNPPEDDDGPIYLANISNATPLFLPSAELDTLVTCRLEKYREPTEQWLKTWNVRYKRLVMLDLPNKKARIEWNRHGMYKGEVYRESNCCLFVESSLRQAVDIAKISGKPVFCTETFSMINPNANFEKLYIKTKVKLRRLLNYVKKRF